MGAPRAVRPMSGRARPAEPLADWCEARLAHCEGRASHRHHRRMRSQGGSDDATNTTDLCGACHRQIHANPRWSYQQGWLVPSWQDPATFDPRETPGLFGQGADWGDR